MPHRSRLEPHIPGAEVYNYYPDWAINKEIKPPLKD